jgi:hypothetical protein
MANTLSQTKQDRPIDWFGIAVVIACFLATAGTITLCFVLAALDHAGML